MKEPTDDRKTIRKILTNCSSIQRFKTTSLAFTSLDFRNQPSKENTHESIERPENLETEKSDEQAEDRAERAREVGQAIMKHLDQRVLSPKKNDYRFNSAFSNSYSLS